MCHGRYPFQGLDETEPDEMVLLDLFCITTYLLVDREFSETEVADSLKSLKKLTVSSRMGEERG